MRDYRNCRAQALHIYLIPCDYSTETEMSIAYKSTVLPRWVSLAGIGLQVLIDSEQPLAIWSEKDGFHQTQIVLRRNLRDTYNADSSA